MSIKTEDLFEHIPPHLRLLFESCEYPWQIVARISEYINEILKNGIEGYSHYSDGVLVGKGASISPSAHISPPAIIGDDCEIRVGAYIRGNVMLGRGVVVGNSTELKNCILLDGAQAPHYNYVGDSLLGARAHLGAGAICSNLRSDGREVIVRADQSYLTGMRKLGAILGDRAEIGCGCVLNPGTIVGKNSRIYPLTSVRGIVPPDCIMKSPNEIVSIKAK
jgi:NDP-sugar pyrophosphorylase family protein